MKDNDIFKDVQFDFFGDEDIIGNPEPYFTLIIGPNGTGKSYVLRCIIDIFRIAYEKKNNFDVKSYINGKFHLEYYLDDANYVITNRMGWENGEEKPESIIDEAGVKGIRFLKNGSEEISLENFKIPAAITALSIMLTDKFLVLKENSDFSIYNYLGVRRDANTAGTRSLLTRTIDYIFKSADKEHFISDVKELLHFLNLEEELYVHYSPRYKHIFFRGGLTLETFEDFFQDYKSYLKRETEPWSIGIFRSIKKATPEIIPELVESLNFLASILTTYSGTRSKYFEFNLLENNDNINRLLKVLPYLHRLDLISYPGIVVKKGGYYDIEESSSGEYHFLSSVIGLLATIKDNTLVLVDEPEISLHPNWQMKYIDFLNKVFRRYNSAHFIICTHSHFLVSDIKPENSKVISVQKKDKIVAETVDYNTYGWSAENVLLKVFNVATTRNYYIAERLAQIFKIASSSVSPDLTMYKDELIGWYNQLSNDDPLHYTIEKLLNRFEWLN
ncbi:MAG: AAA family ATPase [Bacteroidetes bacterium]|nr:AAA family ATPase [Bacteroidota bacterium]